MGTSVCVLDALPLFQLSAPVPRKAEDGLGVWTPCIHLGDLDGVPGFCFGLAQPWLLQPL